MLKPIYVAVGDNLINASITNSFSLEGKEVSWINSSRDYQSHEFETEQEANACFARIAIALEVKP